MTRDELIDEMAITECGEQYFYCATTSEAGKNHFRNTARLSVARIEELINGFEDLLNGKAVIVPVERTHEMIASIAPAHEGKEIIDNVKWRMQLAKSPYRVTK
jgi:hypothetical protein